LGAKDYKTFTWEELGAATNQPIANSPLNKVETLASAADDLVPYYSRVLHGDFFKNKETLNEWQRGGGQPRALRARKGQRRHSFGFWRARWTATVQLEFYLKVRRPLIPNVAPGSLWSR
jgi:hypothetical protein